MPCRLLISISGLDYDQCFFYDPNVPVPIGILRGSVAYVLMTAASSTGAGEVNMAHRKIVRYVPLADGNDDRGTAGHGTHVVGYLLSLHSCSIFAWRRLVLLQEKF